MNIERKFIDLKDLTVTEEGPGEISGYRAVFGEIDEGGDLIVKGFFDESLTEYLEAGFTTHSHDWDFDKTVGYPLEAKEDDHGLYVKSEFHTTPDAQSVRQKALERKKAGKRVGFSFGYSIKDKAYIEAKDFKEQLPLYVKAERLQANLQKAQNFDRIRILKKGEIIEDAIVTAPMNKLAMAAGVKSKREAKKIMKCKPEDMEEGKPWCLYSSDGETVLGRHATREECVEQEEAMMDKSDDDEFSLKERPGTDSFESFESVEAVLTKFVENMQRNHANRVKEGRMLSGANRAKVQAAYDCLGELLAASDTMPKEPMEEEKIDVSALRTQSRRVRNRLMSDYALVN